MWIQIRTYIVKIPIIYKNQFVEEKKTNYDT